MIILTSTLLNQVCDIDSEKSKISLNDTYLPLLKQAQSDSDPAHDLEHIKRVVFSAMKICEQEEADQEIVEAAAWLHDCVVLPKDHPERHKASTLAAEKAEKLLVKTGFPKHKVASVKHAIEAHSFSAGIQPETVEAEIVQDADRLDAIGAIGIARCFLTGGVLGRHLYNPEDPFCTARKPDESQWTIDHFYQKLFKLPEMMNTVSAKKEAEIRISFMKKFIIQLESEIR